MGATHTVRLEPVGIEFEVDEDETILKGAFRQGLMLMHGCKEGQCAACKSFLLEGDVDMDSYSTFALADYEKEEGYVLLCRSHAYSDVEVELSNYDEEVLRSGVPIKTVQGRVEAIESLTHDIRRLVVGLNDAARMAFSAGQYVDVSVPGSGFHRSFSMANTPATPERLEFMIKLYPNGRFSGLLQDGGLKVGDAIEVTGPYGLFILRGSSTRPLIFIGGGAGMAPIASLLGSMAEKDESRPATYYYGARREPDLFHLDELRSLQDSLSDFTFVPALSEAGPQDGWDGESGLITDVVDRREGDLGGVDAYVCGPPPMVDAAIELLGRKGVDESRIYYDKFTITAEAEEGSRT
jgi:propane monooxygenase reductase subunit